MASAARGRRRGSGRGRAGRPARKRGRRGRARRCAPGERGAPAGRRARRRRRAGPRGRAPARPPRPRLVGGRGRRDRARARVRQQLGGTEGQIAHARRARRCRPHALRRSARRCGRAGWTGPRRACPFARRLTAGSGQQRVQLTLGEVESLAGLVGWAEGAHERIRRARSRFDGEAAADAP
ncbi:MAG: hypothetical protein AVDCRST_MAG40-15 [uncultured Gemmatimonadaceae bacterium]|uniref:Uncharacterized protein n=1 Tax=uncultured Gemmatimonadaceae bacterium TaxID=246130 RepID=A0A6J4K424_9BACT|nr:MAG: hypothetical protein AVDCRST_MAG40-15 [uncultured Gemmatimonadaceae bacterium]